MYGTVDCCDYIDSSPSLAQLLNHLADAAKDHRLGILLAWIGWHGTDYSVQYLQPNWRQGEKHETPLVTLESTGDTIAVDLADNALEDTVMLAGQMLGY